MSIRQNTSIGCRILHETCGKLAPILQEQIERSIKRNGPEWTCARMKAVYSAALNLLDDQPDRAKKVYQDNSISYHKGTLLPKGPWGIVVKRLLDARRPSVVRRQLAALRVYTQLRALDPKNGGTLRTLTPKQARKVIPAITEGPKVQFSDFTTSDRNRLQNEVISRGGVVTIEVPFTLIPGTDSALRELAENVKENCFLLPLGRKAVPDKNFYFQTEDFGLSEVQVWDTADGMADACCLSLVKRMRKKGYRPERITDAITGAENLRATSTYYSPWVLPVEMSGEPYASLVLSLNSTEYCPSTLDAETRCVEMRRELRDRGIKDSCIGMVFAVQEAGFKGRGAACPGGWTQLALQPYHQVVDRACRQLFSDEYDIPDQTHGAYLVMQHMTKGLSAYCVDLSSATDRFPRVLTERLMQILGYPEYAEAIEEISSMPWLNAISPEGSDDPRHLHYGTGQPMGSYGSMPAFSLSLMCLCDAAVHLAHAKRLATTFGGPVPQDIFQDFTPFSNGAYFADLGDDLVCSDRHVYDAIKECLDMIGVSTSPEKCFDNGHVAEYAGFLVINRGGKLTVARPYKVSGEGKYIANPLDYLHAVGVKSFNPKHRSKFWNDAWAAYQRTAGRRDISLAPLGFEPREPGVANRASASELGRMSVAIGYHLEHTKNKKFRMTHEEVQAALPLLGEDPHVNRKPLIDEKRPDELYAYDPMSFRPSQDDKPRDWRLPSRRIEQDPLIREEFAKMGRPVPNKPSDPYVPGIPASSGPASNGRVSGIRRVPKPGRKPEDPYSYPIQGRVRNGSTTHKPAGPSGPWERRGKPKTALEPCENSLQSVPRQQLDEDLNPGVVSVTPPTPSLETKASTPTSSQPTIGYEGRLGKDSSWTSAECALLAKDPQDERLNLGDLGLRLT